VKEMLAAGSTGENIDLPEWEENLEK